jgi:hypothetical protein
LDDYPPENLLRRSSWQPGDYPCARSKRYYAYIMERVFQPDKLPKALVLAEAPSKITLAEPNRLG